MTALARAICEELSRLRPATTMCPGVLARKVLPAEPFPLAALRPTLETLAAANLVRVTQRGRPARLETLRGPFRVAPGSDLPVKPAPPVQDR